MSFSRIPVIPTLPGSYPPCPGSITIVFFGFHSGSILLTYNEHTLLNNDTMPHATIINAATRLNLNLILFIAKTYI